MRLSNGTEFRFGPPKYSRIHAGLIQYGGAFFLLSMFVQEPASGWIGWTGLLLLVSGLIVLVAGTIAERREWEAAHRLDGSQ